MQVILPRHGIDTEESIVGSLNYLNSVRWIRFCVVFEGKPAFVFGWNDSRGRE